MTRTAVRRLPNAIMVTGAGSGIGQAITAALLRSGVTVFAGALNDAEVDKIGAYPVGNGSVHPVLIDVRDDGSVAATAAGVARLLGDRPLGGLLNVAGIGTNGPLLDLSSQTLRDVLEVNLVGMHTVTRRFLPLLRRRPGARVVNISSASGRRTLPFTGAYSASKFAVEALSTAMRLEFAPLGVHVAVIAPGLIKTPMSAKIERDLAVTPSEPVYTRPLAAFRETATKSIDNGVPIEKVVNAAFDALTRDKPRARYEIHNDFVRDVILLRVLPQPVRDRVLAHALSLPSTAPGGTRR